MALEPFVPSFFVVLQRLDERRKKGAAKPGEKNVPVEAVVTGKAP